MNKNSNNNSEQNLKIDYYSTKIAYYILQLAILIYCLISLAKNQELPLWPFIIVCSSSISYLIAKQVLKKNDGG